VQGGRDGTRFAHLVVCLAGLFRGLGDELDAGCLERLLGRWRDAHPAIGALANNQQIRTGNQNVLQVGGLEDVTFPAPPAAEHSVRQDDHIALVGLAVNDQVSEAVSVDPWFWHGLSTSFA
jgi:hypothetical protein